MKLFNWVLKLKILSAKKVSRCVAIDANKHLRHLVADRSTQAIGRATKEWIIDVSLYIGVKHRRWANDGCLIYIEINIRAFIINPPPYVATPNYVLNK